MNADEPRNEHADYETVEEAGGDPACWAGLVCQECGAVIAEGHRPGCPAAPGQQTANQQIPGQQAAGQEAAE